MSDIRFSIRRQVAVIWHILANIGDAGYDINNLTKGSFNNYVDQILPNFDHLPNSSGQYYLSFVPVNKRGLSIYQVSTATDHLPTSSCPRSYWMTHFFTQWFEMRRSRHRISNSWFDELMSVRFVLHYSDITSPRSDRGRPLTHNGAKAFL